MDEATFRVGELPYAVRRQWQRVVLCLLAGGCVAVVGAAALGERYTAEARIVVSGVGSGDTGLAARNEAEILRDPSVMRALAPAVLGAQAPVHGPLAAWRARAVAQLRQWRVLSAPDEQGALSRALSVEAVPGTEVIALRFTWTDPVFAATALNTLLRDQQGLASGHEEASQGVQIAQSRVTDAVAALKRVEGQIQALSAEGGVSADAGTIEREKDRVTSRIAAARASIDGLKVERDLQAKKLEAAEKAYAGGSWVDNPDQALGGQMMDPAFMDLVEKRGKLLTKQPADMAKVQEIDHQIAAAREHAFMGVRNTLGERVSALDTQIGAQGAGLQADERGLQALDDRLVQIEALQTSRQVAEGQEASAERALEAARRHAEQAMRDAAGLRVVSEAAAPYAPDFPSPGLILLAGSVLGLVMGVVWAEAAERRRITIDRVQDIARVLRLPVLASVPELR